MLELEETEAVESTSLILRKRQGRQRGKVTSARAQCRGQDWSPALLNLQVDITVTAET